jgi:hypothetical protein
MPRNDAWGWKELMDKVELPRLTPLQRRVIAAAGIDPAEDDLLFQHTVFCQTCLPYRDPGDDVREWARVNGAVHLKVLAGEALHPETERFVPVGLPFGPKPRLVLAHLNAEALRTGSPVIKVEGSLRAFVRRLKLDPKGRNMRIIKDQLARLSASSIRLGLVQGGRAMTVNSQIVTAFDLWFPKDDRQRVLWPSTVQLSADYFQSLTKQCAATLSRLPGQECGHFVAQAYNRTYSPSGSWRPRSGESQGSRQGSKIAHEAELVLAAR